MEKEITELLLRKLKDHCSETAFCEVSAEDNLIEKGVLDSMTFLEFLTDIERSFDISVDFGDLDPNDFLTLEGLARYIAVAKSMKASTGR